MFTLRKQIDTYQEKENADFYYFHRRYAQNKTDIFLPYIFRINETKIHKVNEFPNLYLLKPRFSITFNHYECMGIDKIIPKLKFRLIIKPPSPWYRYRETSLFVPHSTHCREFAMFLPTHAVLHAFERFYL